jgi:hypothetical protein
MDGLSALSRAHVGSNLAISVLVLSGWPSPKVRRGCLRIGAGTGHHSPIGGYLEAEDLVFVLDVNRDYQPWLIERARLFAAMDTWDGNKKRGLLLIE